MRSLSAELKVWKDAQSRLVPLITLFEIEVNDTTTLRLVQGDPTGTGSVTFGGNTYMACAIEREAHEENIEGDFPSFQLVVSNINGVAGGYIEQNELDGREVTIRIGLLRGAEADYLSETHTISQAAYNRKQAILTLGPPNFFKRKTCARKFQRMRCQFPWGQRFLDDAECGYPSDVFGPDTRANFFPSASLVDTEKELQFGWWGLNGTKLTRISIDSDDPGVLEIASSSDEIEWEPGFLNAPYCFKKLSGDFEVFTEVMVDAYRVGYFAGLLCQSVDDLTSWVYLGQAISESVEQYIRGSAAVAGVLQIPIVYAGDTRPWLRMIRSGDVFTCYYGADGVTWTSLGAFTVAMTAPIRLGLCLSAPRQEKGSVQARFGIFQFRSGGDTACERTREACRLKGNIHRYGAFPGIPTLR